MQRMLIVLSTALSLLVMQWEYERMSAASIVMQTEIPEESLRLRILANSDAAHDQWLKQQVRDAVSEQVTEWVGDVQSLSTARNMLQQSLSEIEHIAESVIRENGSNYSVDVEYGDIVFPGKLYGSRYYPADEYEGLLITLGEGQGENWWCVLFPPLCFVDFGTGEVIDPQSETVHDPDATQSLNQSNDQVEKENELEVRFFLVEWVEKVKAWFV